MHDQHHEAQPGHEKQLIQALNRLEHSIFEKEFSGAEALVSAAVQEQYFAFYIGHTHFVVKADSFCAVFVDTPIAAVPNAPSSLLGLSNIRGTLTPVYQLHSSLNEPLPRKHFIFCIGKGDTAIGLLIDALPASLLFADVERIDSQLSNDLAVIGHLTNGFYLAEQKKWYLINGERFAQNLLALANGELKQTLSINSRTSFNQTAQL